MLECQAQGSMGKWNELKRVIFQPAQHRSLMALKNKNLLHKFEFIGDLL